MPAGKIMRVYTAPRPRARPPTKKSKYDKKQDRQIRQMLFSNLGYHSTATPAPTAVSTAGQIFGLLDIDAGDGNSQRQGRRITIHYINIRYSMLVADASNVMRVILFKDRACNSANTPITEVISLNPPQWLDHPNRFNSKRIRILQDRTYDMVFGNTNSITDQMYHRFKTPLEVTYANATNLTPENNGLFLLAISDSGVITHPTIDFRTQTKFSQ